MLSEPNISYKPFWGICRPLNSWRANSPNPIQIYCAKDLKVRDWTCPKCHSNHDRDVNASINILMQGILANQLKLIKNRRNCGDSLVRKVSIETCSQESRHFSDERFKRVQMLHFQKNFQKSCIVLLDRFLCMLPLKI